MKLGGISMGRDGYSSGAYSGAGISAGNRPGGQYGTPGASPFVLTNSGSSGGRGASGTCPPGFRKTTIGRGMGAWSKCVPLPPRPVTIARPAPRVTTTVTVNPSFQQQFTPQFSPTMQQQQDSPGASQDAEPAQDISTPQFSNPVVTPSRIIMPAAPVNVSRRTYAPPLAVPDNVIPSPQPEPVNVPRGEYVPHFTDIKVPASPVPVPERQDNFNYLPWVMGGVMLLILTRGS